MKHKLQKLSFIKIVIGIKKFTFFFFQICLYRKHIIENKTVNKSYPHIGDEKKGGRGAERKFTEIFYWKNKAILLHEQSGHFPSATRF